MRQLAKHSGKNAVYIFDYEFYSEWVLVTQNRQFLDDLRVVELKDEWESPPKPIIWTDDYSNFLEVIKR